MPVITRDNVNFLVTFNKGSYAVDFADAVKGVIGNTVELSKERNQPCGLFTVCFCITDLKDDIIKVLASYLDARVLFDNAKAPIDKQQAASAVLETYNKLISSK